MNISIIIKIQYSIKVSIGICFLSWGCDTDNSKRLTLESDKCLWSTCEPFTLMLKNYTDISLIQELAWDNIKMIT
jgi:hypothetical protein